MPEITRDLDCLWLLSCSVIVFLMQAGFSCLEAGLVRNKNSINVAVKNLLDFILCSLIFIVFGFSIMFGEGNGFIGWQTDLFGNLSTNGDIAFFLFQLCFCGTAVTIISGAIAERVKLASYLLIVVIVSLFIYPVTGRWVWKMASDISEAGWLNQMGFHDFAGAVVVHSVGGSISLALLFVIGPRIGVFNDQGKRFVSSNLPLATLGAFILWFGWFGFNAGSLYRFDSSVSHVLLNTLCAAISAGFSAVIFYSIRGKIVSVPGLITSILAGLVSVTACCDIVNQFTSMIIGATGGLLSLYGSYLLIKLKIDDAVDAIPVHLVAGVWGSICVGLFGDMEQLKCESRIQQIGVQVMGTFLICIFCFVSTYVIFKIINKKFSLRVSQEAEMQGLNISEHGATTELFDLMAKMEEQRISGDYSQRLEVEPHTTAAMIAERYNEILDDIEAEKAKTEEKTRLVRITEEEQRKLNQELEVKLKELSDFNRLAAGREMKIIELKKEIEALKESKIENERR